MDTQNNALVQETPARATQEAPNLRDTLREQFLAHDDDQGHGEPAPAPETDEPMGDLPEAGLQDQGGADDAPPAGDEPQMADAPAVELSEEAQRTLAYLPADYRKSLEGLPAQVVEQHLARERERNAEFIRKTQAVSDVMRAHNELSAVVQPYGQYIAAQGMTLPQKIGQLLAFEAQLAQNPKGTIAGLAQQFGMASLEEGADGQSEIDPVAAHVGNLQARLDAMEAEKQQQALASAQQRANVSIAEFEAARTPDGAPMFPHFAKPAVRTAMAHLIRTGQASGLQDAYQRVIADLGFQQRQQPQAQQRQAQQAAAPRKSAKDAKKAAVGLRSGNTGSPGEAPASLRDELRMRLSKSAR